MFMFNVDTISIYKMSSDALVLFKIFTFKGNISNCHLQSQRMSYTLRSIMIHVFGPIHRHNDCNIIDIIIDCTCD